MVMVTTEDDEDIDDSDVLKECERELEEMCSTA